MQIPYIDPFLNRITMYRLVLLGLTGLAALSIVLGFFGVLPYGGLAQLASLILMLVVAYCTDELFSRLLRVDRNVESVYITAFILFFVLAPVASVADAIALSVATILAIASKYLFVFRGRHIFNPAAFGAGVLSLAGVGLEFWWVATPTLLPYVAILGALIVRKIRRADVFFSFVAASVIFGGAYSLNSGEPLTVFLSILILSTPLVFLGTIMLTEPTTLPSTRKHRAIYGIIVGALSSVPFSVGALYMTPALALLAGNLYTPLVTNTRRLTLALKEKIQLSPAVWEFVFSPDHELAYRPGQYLEWTLGHAKPDARGVRRYFTIASAPEDPDLRIGIRVGDGASSFKKALMALEPGAHLSAGSLGGEFTLPKDASEKLLFIAGGVGITPFISMIRHLNATKELRDIVLIYAAANAADFAYEDVLSKAEDRGIRVNRVVGPLAAEGIRNAAPDVRDRTAYLSGPDGMVKALSALIRKEGVRPSRIKTDYFPGL